MKFAESFFYGTKRLIAPLRLSRFEMFRKANRLAWVTLRLQDEYLTMTASMAASLLRIGDVAVDVGANRGVVARAMQKAVGPSGKVHAFEPNSRIVPDLQRIEGLHVYSVALGRASKFVKLFVPAKNDTISSLSYDAVVSSATTEELQKVSTEEVEVRTLDSFNLARVRLIKVDAQGAELEVLLGAKKTIRRWDPAILVEVWPDGLREFGATESSIMKFLWNMGYTTVRFGGGPTWWDILAIPKKHVLQTKPKPANRRRSRSK